MAIKTQRDEILFLILTGVAAKRVCGELQDLSWSRTADSASHRAAVPDCELPVTFLLEPNRRLFGK